MGIAWGSPPQFGCIFLHKFRRTPRNHNALYIWDCCRSMSCVCHFVVYTLGYFGPMFLSNPSLSMQIIRNFGRKKVLLQKCMSNRLKRVRKKKEPTTKTMPNVWGPNVWERYSSTKCFCFSMICKNYQKKKALYKKLCPGSFSYKTVARNQFIVASGPYI